MQANTPNLDLLAQLGQTGLIKTIPAGFTPGSDVANLSLLGYDPAKYYTGRGPLEAANLGVELKAEDVAYRCNLVTVIDNIMEDFTAGHISTREADSYIKILNKQLGNERIRFVCGTSYRHVLIINNGPNKIITTPPHDITGQNIKDFLPKGKDSSLIRDLMELSKQAFPGKYPSQIWLWGQGRTPSLPNFKELFGLTGGVITAVDLIKGIARLTGLEAPYIEGATGYYDTDYQAKAKAALKILADHDFVFIHVEAPDEAGHEGNRPEKIRAIENFDEHIVGAVVKALQQQQLDFRAVVLPDHPTPLSKRTHTTEAVPFILWGKGISADNTKCYNEQDVNHANQLKNGADLLPLLLAQK
jgi:2,3-bisphosphoglycerate-independent phosphoglycerate mutase